MASHHLFRFQHRDGHDEQVPLDQRDGVSSSSSSYSSSSSAQKHLILAEDEGTASDMTSSLESYARNSKKELRESLLQRRRRMEKKKAMNTTPSVSSSVRTLRQKKASSSLLLGKKMAYRCPLSTPVPPWKFFSYGRSSEALILDRDEGSMMKKKRKQQKKNDSVHIYHDADPPCESHLPAMAHVSTRRLASALWQVQPVPFFEIEEQKLTLKRKPFHYQQISLDHHKNQAFQQMINPKMEASANHVENGTESSNGMVRMLHHVWSLEEQHKSTLLSMSELRHELGECRKQLQKLLRNEKNHQVHMENIGRKLMEERSMWIDQQDENIHHALISIMEELQYERKEKIRLKHLHKRMERDFHVAKKALGKALYELEKERNTRETVEDMCDELAQEVDKVKLREEELKRESAKVREEVEEERRMLQMAEVWREERVQMKLKEAKFEMEEKSEVLDKLRSKMDIFLKVKRAGNVKDEDDHAGMDTREYVCNKQPKDGLVSSDSTVLQGNSVLNPKLNEHIGDNANDLTSDEADRHSIETSSNGDSQQSNNKAYHKVEGEWKMLSTNCKALNEEETKRWPNSKPKGLDRTRSRKLLEGRGRADFHDDMVGSIGTGNSDIRESQGFTSANPREGRNGESFGMNAAWLREIVESSRGKSSRTRNWKDFWSSLQPGSPDDSIAKGSNETWKRPSSSIASMQTKLLEASFEDHQHEGLGTNKG